VGRAGARESYPLRRRRRRNRMVGRRAAPRAGGRGRAARLLGGARENRVSPLVCGLVRGVRGGARSRRPRRGGATLSGRHPAGGDRRRARVRRRPKRRHGPDPGRGVGGGPFRIAAVAPWLGLRRAAGSVVLYQMLHTLGMLLSFLTAVVLGALLLPPHPAILAFLALAFVVLAALVVLLVTGHRRGGLEGLLDLLHRLPLLDRVARRLEPKRATLAQMDEQITALYHRHPRRFVQAVALEYLSRSIFMIEY